MRIFFALCAMIFTLSVSAQSKKAMKAFENAKRAIQQDDFDLALSELDKAIDSSPDYADAYVLIGDIQLTKNEPKLASDAYLDAVNNGGGQFLNYKLGIAQMNSLQYAEAEISFLSYLDYGKVRPETKKKVVHFLTNCKFGKVAVKNPVPFDPKSVGAGINTLNYQYHPAISIDGKLLVYTQLDNLNGRDDENFYYAVKENDLWSAGRKMEGAINSRYNEGVQSLTASGNYMFYTICERDDSKGSCDIYVAKYLGEGLWSQGRNLGDSINTRAWESQPSLSPDGNTLFFVRGSNMQDKNTDIFFSSRNKEGKWSKAEALSEIINTPFREMSPFIHFDNSTLYFASQGHPGMGDADLFVSRKDENGEWGKPENLGYPINTPFEEFGLVVSSDGKSAFYASDRIVNEQRTRNIYEFELPEDKRAKSVAWLKGKVTDEKTGKPLKGSIEIVNLETGLPWVSARANSQGHFFTVLPANTDYALNIEKEGYMFYSANVSLKDQSFDEAFMQKVELSPIEKGSKLVLNNIFFETDSYKLLNRSESELKTLLTFLEANPQVNIRVDGHTDNQGSDAHNATLSKNRAISVREYLMRAGISNSRISTRGFGSSQPISSNKTEEGRKMNRRTEVIIL
jgi:outer membrane protein OmpA-like peptidoglycan-associated protein/tetratricopeptide (TPR) repeat protein